MIKGGSRGGQEVNDEERESRANQHVIEALCHFQAKLLWLQRLCHSEYCDLGIVV